MITKARDLMVGILLITLSVTAFQAPLQAQDTPEPAATEDPCIAIIEASMQSQDDSAPVATEDPALTSCLDAFAAAETNATPVPSIALLDESSTSRSALEPEATDDGNFTTGLVYISISVDDGNGWVDAGRVWVTWHDPVTGALTAIAGSYDTSVSGRDMDLTVRIPDNVVGIGIRIETNYNKFSENWQFNPTCAFAFATSQEARDFAGVRFEKDMTCHVVS